jgi:hypothetical protein
VTGVQTCALPICLISLANLGYFNGKKGDVGRQGQQGVTGLRGQQGPPGARGANGTTGPRGATGSSGSTGSRGSTGATGEKGDKGDNGDVGPQGEQGPPGQDAPVNNPSEIELLNLSGYYRYKTKCTYNYVFNITASISDIDDTMMHTTISYMEPSSHGYGVWTSVSESVGSGECFGTVSFSYHSSQGSKTLLWLVEVWDGADLSSQVFEYTVEG